MASSSSSHPSGTAVQEWFGGVDDQEEAAHIQVSRGAGPSRHGAITLATSQRQAQNAETSVDPIQSVAKDHRRMAALPSAKKFSSYIDRWNTQHRSDDADAKDTRKKLVSGQSAVVHGDTAALDSNFDSTDDNVAASTSKAPHDFDYADEVRKACLLCQRQFKAAEVLRRHVAESDLHKRNLGDEAICTAGRARKAQAPSARPALPANMKRAGFAPVAKDDAKNPSDSDDGPQYRDRASERRTVFGVEKRAKPWAGPKIMAPVVLKDAKAVAALSQPKREEAAPRPALDEGSVGGSLLAKMGWSTGKGLGASRDGRVDPVQASMYAPGAGLGSARSKPETVEEHAEALKKRARVEDASYSDYLKDRTRMRFAKAGESS